jgi:hypothetical protein
MVFRIETVCEEQCTTLRLVGRIRSELLEELQVHIQRSRPTVVLDLDQVTLVDVDVVRFLGTAERQGIELRRCPPFIREWISREQKPDQELD